MDLVAFEEHKNVKSDPIRRFLIFVLVVVAGCAPMAEIEIQVMDPADITLPPDVHQLAFMNRSVFPHLIHTDTSSWSKEEYFILDTIMNTWIFKGVRTSMDESPLYDIDSIHIIPARRSDTIKILIPLDKSYMRTISRQYDADALVSLEYYHVDDSINVELYYNGQGYYHQAYMGFYTTSIWRIYDLKRYSVLDEFAIQDTAVWFGYGDSYESALWDLPTAVNAIRTAALEIGRRYGYRISPGWMGVPRFYYGRGSKDMRTASRASVSGDWQRAKEIWKQIADNPENEKLAARACFNLALFYEMDDLLIPALDWAIKSYSIRQDPLTREYIDLLQQRFEDRKKLREQLPALEY